MYGKSRSEAEREGHQSDGSQVNAPLQELNADAVQYIARIRGLHQLFEETIKHLRGDLDRCQSRWPTNPRLRRADYWRFLIAYNGCVRLRQIIESNFLFIETLALLATVRYIFELSIWTKLATTREDYALAYYGRLLEKQVEQAERHVGQVNREIGLLDELEALDRQSTTDAIITIQQRASSMTEDDVRELMQAGSTEVDRRAARMFSLYAEQGKADGFGFTAHLVRTQAVPQAAEKVRAAHMAMEEFLSWCPEGAKALVKRGWKWNREAKEAGMEGAYDFLYSYVSRLLHATPASVMTDQKHLEPDEIVILLRYVYGALLDVLDLVGDLRARQSCAPD